MDSRLEELFMNYLNYLHLLFVRCLDGFSALYQFIQKLSIIRECYRQLPHTPPPPPPHRLSSYKLQSSKLPSYALLIYSFPQTPSYNLPSIFSYMHLSRLPSCSLSPNTLPSYTLSSFSLPSHTHPSCNLSPHTLPFYTLLSYTLAFPHHFTL